MIFLVEISKKLFSCCHYGVLGINFHDSKIGHDLNIWLILPSSTLAYNIYIFFNYKNKLQTFLEPQKYVQHIWGITFKDVNPYSFP